MTKISPKSCRNALISFVFSREMGGPSHYMYAIKMLFSCETKSCAPNLRTSNCFSDISAKMYFRAKKCVFEVSWRKKFYLSSILKCIIHRFKPCHNIKSHSVFNRVSTIWILFYWHKRKTIDLKTRVAKFWCENIRFKQGQW